MSMVALFMLKGHSLDELLRLSDSELIVYYAVADYYYEELSSLEQVIRM